MNLRPLLLLLPLLAPLPAQAHGLWGHIHVTGWAAENMPDDELREFLLEPEVFNALIFGATFTDTGYSIDDPASRAYSEHTHWEPFIQDYVEWIRVNDPPPWNSLESRKRVAFLMGCGSHGLQDEIFDTLFLAQAEVHDGVGQEATDPGTDGFLALDDYLRFTPQQDIPMETLLQLYEVLDEEVTEEVIQRAVDLVTGVYINDTVGHVVAEDLGNRYAEQIPWTREHYLDAELPGSLQAEIYPTLHYQQALWARLHDGLSADEVTVYAYPESPRRLLGALATTPDSWLSVVFGVGVRYEEDLLELRDAEGSLVPTTMGNSRWGPTFPRIVRLMPAQDLQPGGWYTLRLRAGVETIDGQQSDQPWELEFQVECDSSTTGSCEDLGDIPEARTDGKLEETEDSGKVEPEACGCSSGGDLSWGLGLFGLGALRRKRRV